LLTQVAVDPRDPAFARPTKPIGPVYNAAAAARLEKERSWTMARDGAHFRRVVASPAPRRILELRAIRHLIDAGVIVVCAGGGGIPVVVADDWTVRGVEAVIDKDRSAALLAEAIGAEALLLLTDVPAVYERWGTPDAAPIREATGSRLRELALDRGSMGPKAEAAARFVEATGGIAAIGALADAFEMLRGEAGTRVTVSRTA
jgi:carbamate kinase